MKRLQNPSTNAYGCVEHVYSPCKVHVIAQNISDNEWTAIGSAIAKTMLERILDVGDDALKKRGWVERTTVTNRIAKEVLSSELPSVVAYSSSFFSPAKNKSPTPISRGCHFIVLTPPPVPRHPTQVSGSKSKARHPPESPA
jgi:hypothetical protein